MRGQRAILGAMQTKLKSVSNRRRGRHRGDVRVNRRAADQEWGREVERGEEVVGTALRRCDGPGLEEQIVQKKAI